MESSPSRVVVLEDDVARMDWLDAVLVGTGVRADVVTTVRDFRETMADASDVALVILDHDLGPNSVTSADRHGECGLDAARWLPAVLAASIPVLVWSANVSGGQAMEDALAERGFNVRREPFLHANKWTLRQVILGVL